MWEFFFSFLDGACLFVSHSSDLLLELTDYTDYELRIEFTEDQEVANYGDILGV